MEAIMKFNVLCVTKRFKDFRDTTKRILWHDHSIRGEAVMHTDYSGASEKIMIHFFGKDHELLGVRSGLSGTAVTLGVACNDEPFEIWELYTDTPVASSDATPERIREIAKLTDARWG
jgi:hypothetical protein